MMEDENQDGIIERGFELSEVYEDDEEEEQSIQYSKSLSGLQEHKNGSNQDRSISRTNNNRPYKNNIFVSNNTTSSSKNTTVMLTSKHYRQSSSEINRTRTNMTNNYYHHQFGNATTKTTTSNDTDGDDEDHYQSAEDEDHVEQDMQEEYQDQGDYQDQDDEDGYYMNNGSGQSGDGVGGDDDEGQYEDQEEEDDAYAENQTINSNGNGYSQNQSRGDNGYGNGGYDDDEEEEYPNTLQFCVAQFDDGGLEDDEEERGLPPPQSRGYFGETDEDNHQGEGSSKTRITTNESGIRIVESSTILEPEADDDEDYEQYGGYEESQIPLQLQVQQRRPAMNKPRKFRPEKAVADALLRQFTSPDQFDNNKPNILARKLMGVPSQTVLLKQQQGRPPPLKARPIQGYQLQQKPSPVPLSLESILRQQQRPRATTSSTSNMPQLKPKTASSLLLSQNQLKIKSSHGIPTSSARPSANSLQQRQQQQRAVQRFQQNSQSATTDMSRRLFLNNQQSSASSSSQQQQQISNLIIRRARQGEKIQQQKNYQLQQARSTQLNSSGIGSGKNSNGSGSGVLNRITISSIQAQLQAQQKNGLQLKPLKNVPRCHVCKRTFATNQVLQRHMALHGAVATIQESESGEYKCDVCLEDFESPFQLAKHMQSHDNTATSSTSSVHRCRVCYRTFTCLESLKAHSMMHDGEFKCRACRRGFPDWKSLEEHEATHKRYNCNWCEKYFMNSGNLKAHERIHTGERPYKCADCPKAFKQLGGLQYHLKTNPNHKPQKYHKMDDGNNEDGMGQSGDYSEHDGSMNYEDGSDQEYEDSANYSLMDIAASAGY